MLHNPKKLSIDLILLPFQLFARTEASSGILLLIATVMALIWANSPWAATYTEVWQTKLTIGVGTFALSKALILWINDGLMAIFFFVVGLEIKREVLVGELASLRKATLPIAAAIGGMIVPALLYTLLNLGQPGARGWGVPMATDIAFALGVLALLGRRATTSLKVFLTALAIVDDIGAVLVIALFYTAGIIWPSLAVGAIIMLVLVMVNRAGIRYPLVYGVLGIGLWLAFLLSGVHATIAGVLLAMTIPAKARINAQEFADQGRRLLDEFEGAGTSGADTLTNEHQQAAVYALEEASERVQTPLQRLEHALHPWVSYVIMPVFALANAGVAIGGNFISALAHPVSLGVIVGLVVGKLVGISFSTWLTVRSGLATLPSSVTWRHIIGASLLGGIGFTMSLFIAELAFNDSPLLASAKMGILAASFIAGVAGFALLQGTQPVDEQEKT